MIFLMVLDDSDHLDRMFVFYNKISSCCNNKYTNNKFIRGIDAMTLIFASFQSPFQLDGKRFVDGKPHCCEYQAFVKICLKP